CRPAISPHAPYSVRASLFQAATELARQRNLPLATHLAETSAEIELLQHRRGPLVDFLSELGVWDPAGLVKRPEEVLQYFAGLRNVLCIHANYLANNLASRRRAPTEGSAALGSNAGGSPTVVYCPRTHAVFGHAPHPFRELLRLVIRVALGTY